jgi:hypothetical protein
MKRPRTVNISEIAELLRVTHQRTSVIVRQPGFPARSTAKVRAASGIGARSRRGRSSGGAADYLDRVGTSIEVVQNVFGTNHRPTGQRGFDMHFRVGAD